MERKVAVIYYRFTHILYTYDDISNISLNTYYSYKVCDKVFLTGHTFDFNSEILNDIISVIPNFFEGLLLTLDINSNYCYSGIKLSSEIVSEEQMMYLSLKGIKIEVEHTSNYERELI